MNSRARRDDAALAVGLASAAVRAWRFRGALRATVIVKASFAFADEAPMARTAPQDILRAEVHHGEDPRRSVRLTADLVPYLDRAEVVFTGHAHAPPETSVESLPVRLGVFDGTRAILDKALIVRKSGGFRELPMVYEHAYGGIGWPDNPFGRGATEGTDEPNILDPFVETRVAGFGPIGEAWAARRALLGVGPRGWLGAPILEVPDDLAWELFHAAPADQRIPFLRGDEWIVMDGLHPTLPRTRMRLPGARGLSRVYGLSPFGVDEGQPLALVADVLRIDGDEQRCTLTFRGSFPVAGEAALAALRVVAGVELPGEPVVWPDPAAVAAREGDQATATAAPRAPRAPFAATIALSGDAAPPGPALPFHASGTVQGAAPPAPVPGGPAPRRPAQPAAFAATVVLVADPVPGEAPPSAPMRAPPRSPSSRPPASFAGTLDLTPADEARAASHEALPFHEGVVTVGGAPPFPPAPPAVARRSEIPGPSPSVRPLSPPPRPPSAFAATLDLTPADEARAAAHEALPFHDRVAVTPRPDAVAPPEYVVVAPPPLLGPLVLPAAVAGGSPAPQGDPPDAARVPSDPADIGIERCAVIAAQLTDRRDTRAQILAAHGVSEAQWVEVEQRWFEALRDEERLHGTALCDAYDAAFLAEWEAHRQPFELADYARLCVAAEGSGLGAALEAMGVRRTVWARLKRVWSKRVAGDRTLAAAFEREVKRQRRR